MIWNDKVEQRHCHVENRAGILCVRVEEGWTNHELRRMMCYYSRLRWVEHIPYEDFQHDGQKKLWKGE